MNSDKPVIVKCPQCKRDVPWSKEQKFKPFCSERCKMIDLGEWAAEEKRIAGEPCLDDEFFDENFFQ